MVTLVRGFLAVALVGLAICAYFAIQVLVSRQCSLAPGWELPLFVGSGVVVSASILAIIAAGVAGPGPRYLEWMGENIPKYMFAVLVIAGFLTWSVRDQAPTCGEAGAGFLTVFYAFGASVLMGHLRALNR